MRPLVTVCVFALAVAGCGGATTANQPNGCKTVSQRAPHWPTLSLSDRSVLADDISYCGLLKGHDQSYVRALLGEPSRMEAGRSIYDVQPGSDAQGWLRVAFNGAQVSKVNVQSP